MWDLGLGAQGWFSPARAAPRRSPPSRASPPSQGGEKGEELWLFLRNGNMGAFRLARHHRLELTAEYFVPNVGVLQPKVLSVGTAHPGKGQARTAMVSCELCFWFLGALQGRCVPAPCLRVSRGTGHFLGQDNAAGGTLAPLCCDLQHPRQSCAVTSAYCTSRNLLPRALSRCSGQNDF